MPVDKLKRVMIPVGFFKHVAYEDLRHVKLLITMAAYADKDDKGDLVTDAPLRLIAKKAGCSYTNIHKYLKHLIDQGFIENIKLTDYGTVLRRINFNPK